MPWTQAGGSGCVTTHGLSGSDLPFFGVVPDERTLGALQLHRQGCRNPAYSWQWVIATATINSVLIVSGGVACTGTALDQPQTQLFIQKSLCSVLASAKLYRLSNEGGRCWSVGGRAPPAPLFCTRRSGGLRMHPEY